MMIFTFAKFRQRLCPKSLRVRAISTGVLLLIVALGLLSPPDLFAKQKFTIAPPPAWVQQTNLPPPDSPPNDAPAGSVNYLLVDNQLRVSAANIERFYRRVEKVITASGLDEVSELTFHFEPSYQELFIHHIHIVRGNETIDALKPNEIKVIQQEKNLDQRLYNGTLSAIVFLSDVRQGDVIDYAYSINGENPVLRGRFADSFMVGLSEPVEKLKWRLLYPTARPLYIKNHRTDIHPATRPLGNESEYLWESDQVAAIEIEGSTPAWFETYPQVQLSEFASWEEVAGWAAPLYPINQPLSAKLTQQINQWRAELPHRDKRMLAALRFVQDEVRYLGVELGAYSHQPSPPSVVFERRFGDCKDKSLLLAAMLNALGIEAHPALVNTVAQHALDQWQPTPYAFDHCIVQAKLDDKTYWFDPTISYQRGDLSLHHNPNYERALVVREGSKALEVMPMATLEQPAIEVKQIYTLKDFHSPVTLLIATTYRGNEADNTRFHLAGQSLSEVSRFYLRYYAEQDHSIKAEGQPVITDDQETNTLVVTENYSIPEFWTNNERTFYADQIYDRLSKETLSNRHAPLAISHPLYLKQSIEAHMPEPFSIDQDTGTIADDFVRFAYRFTTQGNIIKLDFTLQSLRDTVPAEQTAKHLATIDRIKKYVGYEITRDSFGSAKGGEVTASDGEGAFKTFVWFLFLGPFVIFGTWMGVRRMREKRRVNQFKERLQATPGAAPATAIRLQSEQEIYGHLANFRSACGAPLYQQGIALHQESMSFDGQRLTAIALQCQVCGETRDVYFAHGK
ncbi:MAG: DUF3857 domain-containing protein [Acidobacteria bacterium]|nr:DUF3857 domain-containing protein [Acidobacteriota bacterium]